jgi:hypothetical protein
MSPAEITTLISKKDNAYRKHVFESHYPSFAVLAQRYSKNAAQAQLTLKAGFTTCFNKLAQIKNLRPQELSDTLRSAFIEGAVGYIRSIRNEYYVSSTVYAVEPTRNYDLFDNTEIPDYNSIDTAVFIKGMQQLVPSQRLTFNLCVVDGYSAEDAASLLESSVQTVKSNLEKARYNLQKNITTSIKSGRTEP